MLITRNTIKLGFGPQICSICLQLYYDTCICTCTVCRPNRTDYRMIIMKYYLITRNHNLSDLDLACCILKWQVSASMFLNHYMWVFTVPDFSNKFC